jgi:RimJ/RimL family protein N-acetyltransferase
LRCVTILFETERLAVRPWGHADAERVLDMYSRPEVARFLGTVPKPMTTREEALSTIDRWGAMGGDDPAYGVWCATRRADGLQVGTVLLIPVPHADDGAVEVGWHLHPDWWGQGLATEAAAGALERGWAAGLMGIIALVAPENDASLKVCERLGLQHDGRTDRYYGKELELFRANRPGP